MTPSLFSLFTPAKLTRLLHSIRHHGVSATWARVRQAVALRLWPKQPDRSAAYLQSFWHDAAQAGAFQMSQPPAVLLRRRRIAMVGDFTLQQCRKYRGTGPKELWTRLGVDYSLAEYREIPAAIAALQTATHLMLYRAQSGPYLETLLYEARRLRLPVLYDIDDPLFSIPAYATYGNMTVLPPSLQTHFETEAPKYLSALQQADIVSVSTPGLVTLAQEMTARPVYHRRNFADQDMLDLGAKIIGQGSDKGSNGGAYQAPSQEDDLFRVGFMSGSHGHEADFKTIAPEITAFLGQDPKRRLVILGHFDPAHLPGSLLAQIERYPFADYQTYLTHLARLNCAVMPLSDDLFNRCKSGVRVLDAAVVSVPALVAPIGDLPTHVQDGQTGKIATPGAWGRALEDLAQNPEATRRLGQNARAAVERDWSVAQAAPAAHIIAPELISWVQG